jgi:chromosome segregation ATPase
VAAALERARRAEERAAALERGLLVAEGRAERAEAKVGDARRRARRASEQAGRARRTRDRVRVARRDARGGALERVEELIADADARVRAADDQAAAAARDAAEARHAAAAAERRARELSALVGDGQRRLTGGELAALRADGPSGPAVLAGALRRLAKARAAGDRGGLRSALGEVASAAVRWHDRM